MQILLLLLTILGGMGLSVEAGLLGPLGKEVGELWATFSIFGVGAALTFLLMLFFSPRKRCHCGRCWWRSNQCINWRDDGCLCH